MENMEWKQFMAISLCVGTVIRAEQFPKARKAALVVWVDFGADIGIKKTSAQITHFYTPESLVGKQVMGVVNFPPKQIGPHLSEFLLTGFVQNDGSVVLAVPDQPVQNGLRLG